MLISAMGKEPKVIEENNFSAPEKDISNEEMVAAVAGNQDKQAFISLYNYFAPRIKSFMMKAGITPDAAEELAQETMLTVWSKAGQFDPARAGASTWIFTIARNKRIDYLRKNARPVPDRKEIEFDTGIGTTSASEVISRAEEAEILDNALTELPEEQAELIKKAFFEDKTHKDIAAENNLPLGTVKSRIRLGLERLRHKLGEQIT